MINRKTADLIRLEVLQAMLRHLPTGKYHKPTVEDARFIVRLPASTQIEESKVTQ